MKIDPIKKKMSSYTRRCQLDICTKWEWGGRQVNLVYTSCNMLDLYLNGVHIYCTSLFDLIAAYSTSAFVPFYSLGKITP